MAYVPSSYEEVYRDWYSYAFTVVRGRWKAHNVHDVKDAVDYALVYFWRNDRLNGWEPNPGEDGVRHFKMFLRSHMVAYGDSWMRKVRVQKEHFPLVYDIPVDDEDDGHVTFGDNEASRRANDKHGPNMTAELEYHETINEIRAILVRRDEDPATHRYANTRLDLVQLFDHIVLVIEIYGAFTSQNGAMQYLTELEDAPYHTVKARVQKLRKVLAEEGLTRSRVSAGISDDGTAT